MSAGPPLVDSVDMIEQRFEQLEHRVQELERLAGVGTDTEMVTVAAVEKTQQDPIAESPSAPASTVGSPAPQPNQETPAAVATSGQRGFSLKTSEALLKWAGTGLVLLAVAFALGLAIERGWVTPVVRVAASSVIAVVLFATGQRIRGERAVFADTVQGAAFVVAYLTALSAIVMDLVPGNVGFAAMVLVTLGALFVAALLDSPPIAVLGVLGGFATPVLLESGIDEPVVLAGYIPLLALSGFALHAWTGWRSVAVATSIASWSLLVVLLDQSDAAPVGAAIVVVGVLAWLVPLGRSILEERGRLSLRPMHMMEDALEPFLRRTPERLAYASPAVSLLLLVDVVDLTRYQWSPIVVVLAIVYAGFAMTLQRNGFFDFAYVHTTVAAVLASVGVTLALNGEVLVVSLALQGVALSLLAERLRHKGMDWQAYATFAIALAIILVRTVDRGWGGMPTTSEWTAELIVLGALAWKAIVETRTERRAVTGFVVHVAAIGWLFTVLTEPYAVLALAALYVLTRLADNFDVADFELSNVVHAAAILIVTVWVAFVQYLELVNYDRSLVAALAVALAAMGILAYYLPTQRRIEAVLTYLTLLAWIAVVAGTSDAWITAGWVLVGVVTLAGGVRLASNEAQLAGWITLGLATGKLLLHDLEATDPLVRIGLFFGIGLAFLGLAYLLPTRFAPRVDQQPLESAPSLEVTEV